MFSKNIKRIKALTFRVALLFKIFWVDLRFIRAIMVLINGIMEINAITSKLIGKKRAAYN